MGMGQDTQVILSDQWFTLKLTTHQLLLHFTIKQYHPPTPSALWGQIQTIAKLTNQEIAPDYFSKKIYNNLQAASRLLPIPRLSIMHPLSDPSSCFSTIPVLFLPPPRSVFEMFLIFFLKSSMCTLGAKNVLFCAKQSAQDIVVLKTEMTKPRVIQKKL